MLNIFKEKELTAKEKQEIINEKVAELKNDLEEIQDEIKIQEGRQTKALINNRSDIAEQAREKVSELYSERNGIVNSIKLLEQEQQELGESAIREKIEDLLEQQEQLKEQNSKESKQAQEYLAKGRNLERKCKDRSMTIHAITSNIERLEEQL